MPALNFKKQFVPAVKSGKKRQTIRSVRKRPFVKGDKLYLFTGMRTENCARIKEVVCKSVYTIKIYDSNTTKHLAFSIYSDKYIRLFGKNSLDADSFARKDGFKNSSEMIEWFKQTHGLPFHGQLIKW